MDKEGLQEVVFFNKPGICPRCNKRMILVATTQQLIGITECGVPVKEVGCVERYSNFCPSCGWITPMMKTIDGMKPIPIARKTDVEKDDKPVGIVEGE